VTVLFDRGCIGVELCVPNKQGGMSFRDIHCFNLLLLAKQVRKLLEEPDSLCVRVVRTKYFPSEGLT
jgi:hypothetical protein